MRPSLGLTRRSRYQEAIEAGKRFSVEFGLGDIPAQRLADVMEEALGILVLMVEAEEGISGAAYRCQSWTRCSSRDARWKGVGTSTSHMNRSTC